MLPVWCSCQSLQLLGNDSLLQKSVLKGKEEGQSALDIPEVGKADVGGAAHTVNRSRTGSSDAQLLL